MSNTDLGHIDQSELCGACGEFRGKHWGEAKDYCRGVASRFIPSKPPAVRVEFTVEMARTCHEALSAMRWERFGLWSLSLEVGDRDRMGKTAAKIRDINDAQAVLSRAAGSPED
jgi:hypothetical protein